MTTAPGIAATNIHDAHRLLEGLRVLGGTLLINVREQVLFADVFFRTLKAIRRTRRAVHSGSGESTAARRIFEHIDTALMKVFDVSAVLGGGGDIDDDDFVMMIDEDKNDDVDIDDMKCNTRTVDDTQHISTTSTSIDVLDIASEQELLRQRRLQKFIPHIKFCGLEFNCVASSMSLNGYVAYTALALMLLLPEDFLQLHLVPMR